MTAEDLSLFSYEILGLVGRHGAGPHDLKRLTQRFRMLNWAGESQYYTEPKRLAQLGYLSARKEPGKTRERTIYKVLAHARCPVLTLREPKAETEEAILARLATHI